MPYSKTLKACILQIDVILYVYLVLGQICKYASRKSMPEQMYLQEIEKI